MLKRVDLKKERNIDLVLSLYKEDYWQIFNVCPLDYTAVVVSGKVKCP